MKMKICGVMCAAVLTGCQAYPDNPSAVITVNGNYQAVGDCLYLGLNTLWVKTDLPSSKTVVLTLSDQKGTYARIEAHAISDNKTAVSVRAMLNLSHYTSIINGCSAP